MKATPDPGAGERGKVSLLARLVDRVRSIQGPARRLEIERALRMSEARFAAFMEYLPGCAFIKDEESRFIFLNQPPTSPTYPQGWEGKTADEIAGAGLFPQSQSDDETVRTQRKVIVTESELTLGGVTRIYQLTKFPIPIGDEQVLVGGVAFDITERKRIEEALRKSEASLARAQSMAQMGSWEHDCATNAGKLSAGMFRLLGLDPAQGTPTFAEFVQGVHPDDRETFMEAHQRFLQGGTGLEHEYRIVRPDGAIRWVAAHAEAVFDAAGRPVQLIGTTQDITQRVESEQALRESEEYYRLLFGNSPMSMWVYDLETLRFLSVNETATQHYGYSEADFLAMTLRDIRPAADVAEMEKHASMVESGVQPRLWRHVKKDGGVILVETTGRTISFRGRPARLCLLNDVTERERVQQELAWKTAFLEAQLDASIDGILVVDNEGKGILQNRRAREILNLPDELMASSDRAKRIGVLAAATKHPQRFIEKVEYLVTHPEAVIHDEIELSDGRVLDRYSSPVVGKDGQSYGRIWVFRDISQNKLLEEQLRQSQKLEAIGQLAGGVAHDFNNLLTVIEGNASLLLLETVGASPKDCAQEILQAAERASGLTRQLLVFSRKQVMRPTIVELNDVVANVTKMLRRILGEDIALSTNLGSDLRPLLADVGMLEQILLNLAVNARDAMPEGGRLVVSTRAMSEEERHAAPDGADAAGPFLCLCVHDAGTGIPPEILPRIFEPFFTTKEVGKGTGLGLATVYGIVQQHHGWIAVESGPGEGTTFRIFLPAHQASRVERTFEPLPEILPSGGEAILLVEDEPALRMLSEQVLQHCGYRVVAAKNGPDAIGLWNEHRGKIQLLLTDMIMPGGMSGRELAARLLDERPTLKVIYTTGYSPEVVGRGSILVEGVNFLKKPYQAHTLAQAVRNCLDRQ